MCGLAGYVGIDSDMGRELLQRMGDAMAHRGPDGEGFFTHGQVGLAHRRLAIIDPDGGHQPVHSADGRYTMVYNGELYNFRELRAELQAKGHEFKTHCDSEVVLVSWVEWGRAAFDRFNGMFALVIVDTRTGEVTLARDHFGIKPLYLATTESGVTLFASEIRPILATGLIERKPDDATMYRYLRFRVHDDTERTFFAGVTRLMPGELAVVSPDGTVSKEIYTNLYDELRTLAKAAPQPYDEAAKQKFADELRKAIRRRLVSDVPVGTALSGGLDSSTIVATINEFLDEHDSEAASVGSRQNTFSAVFPGERNDEERYVDAVAARCDALTVHKIKPNPDAFIADLIDFVRTQEEPVISTGPYAQYCVMREASKHVTVMIDGQGADEMMAGYVPYYVVMLKDLRRRGQSGAAAKELSRSLDVLWRLGRFKAADTLLRRRGIPVSSLLDASFSKEHGGERFPVKPDDIKARLEDDIFRHSLQSLLRYEDRNTMRFSVEGRVPFLDVDLLRALWAMDPEAILKDGWNKRALRDAVRDLLPSMIVQRRNKIGFTTPEDAWFVRMKNRVYEIFSSESFGNRPYFNQAAVMDAFQQFLSGRASSETMTFWRLLNVELWLREFIDNDPNVPVEDTREGTKLGDEPGQHDQAPPKSDYVANTGKSLELPGWARFPLRVDLVERGADVSELASQRVSEFFTGLSQAPTEAAALAADGRWYLFVSEKIVAIAQGRFDFIWDIKPGWWARQLSRFVVRTPHGIGLGHPTTMQLAIEEAGLPRILAASAASAAGKAVGKRGLFYQVAGSGVRSIDGPTEYSAYPANVSAKRAPANPSGVAREISAALRAVLPADVAQRFGGTVVIDANDIGRNVLGHDTNRPAGELEAAFADNPLGQGREQTPLCVVVTQPAAVAS